MFIVTIILFGFGDSGELYNVTWHCPMQIVCKAIAGLLTPEPLCHLLDVVFFVAGMIGGFCKVDVKSFWALSTIPIGRSKGNNGSDIVLH